MGDSQEAFDHYIWLQDTSLSTLERVVQQRRWCCSLDVAVLAVLGCALTRWQEGEDGACTVLRLRLTVAVRDGPDEGLLVADFADARDMDLEIQPNAGVEQVARSIASCIRHRQWHVPSPLSDCAGRILLNFRPLLSDIDQPGVAGAWRQQTLWPPVHGESNW